MTNLLIVESPAKCNKIQGFLGPGWRVIATMGHIRALEEELDAVGLERDFEPRFAFLKEKGKAIAKIKDEARDATTVYLASDDDREGEAISYSVAVLLKLNPATTPRAVFHEITESAVKAAVAAPRRIDMNRVFAQQARAVLDMMVGFTISPLLWKYVGQGLSAGRCQTPALRLLVDKEQEIRGFQAATAWRVSGEWSAAAAAGATFPAQLVDELEDRESAENFLENLHDDARATVTSAATRPWTESPPQPLITSTLQQEVSATMGIQPKNTMRIAQRLYEAGHITYMRTDSAVLSEEARAAARNWVQSHYGEAFLGPAAAAPAPAEEKPKAAKAKKSKKGGEDTTTPDTPAPQEAHEAIRPTHFEVEDLPADEDWNASDRKVYTLIWRRAVQSIMAAARGEQRTVEFVAAGDPGEFAWRAQWRRQLFAGWRRIGAAATDLDAVEGEDATAQLGTAWATGAALNLGDKIAWRSLAAQPYTTKPPARYTEATLVRELEKRGIGRPSTFASLVGTIMDKNYAEVKDTPAQEMKIPQLAITAVGQWPPAETTVIKKVGAERKKLAPTPLGLSAAEFCMREFAQLFAYDFTAAMEARLDAVAKGAEPWKQLCRDTWASYEEKYKALKAGQSTVAAASARERRFASGLKAVQSKKGPLLLREGAGPEGAAVFYGWPDGVSFAALTEAAAEEFVAAKVAAAATAELGTYEGNPMVKRAGPYGPYVSCNGVSVPWAPEDTPETLQAKFAAKASSCLHTLGPFEFRRGPYGVYMFKKDTVGKARKFVSLPDALDPKALTEAAAIKIYQNGLQQKAKGAAFKARGGGAGAAAGKKHDSK